MEMPSEQDEIKVTYGRNKDFTRKEFAWYTQAIDHVEVMIAKYRAEPPTSKDVSLIELRKLRRALRLSYAACLRREELDK